MSRSTFRFWGPILISLAVAAMPLHAQTMSLSTYYGANGSTFGAAVATDAVGDAFLVSSTSSSLPCSGQLMGVQNVVVTMVESNGTLGWCTYLGGAGTDYGYGIALDANDDVYVAGTTNSAGLGTPGSYQPDLLGNADAFVAELSPTGSLLWFTYLGTVGSSQANSVYVDSAGGIYVAGYTTGAGWPVAGSVRQKKYGGGGSDIAIAKLNAGGATLAWSGYLGGNGNDVGYRLAVSADGSLACVDGFTTSNNYPTAAGAFQRGKKAVDAAVVTCLNASTGALTASTYFGGSTTSTQPCTACAAGLTFDASGNVWIVGLAQHETSFPITTGSAAQPLYGGGLHDAFISELTSDLSTVLYSTWFGGSGDDGAVAPAFDASGNLWIHGNSFSQNLPVTPNAFQLGNGGDPGTSDAFLLEMSPTAVEYVTYLGGSGNEFGGATQSLAVGPGTIWFTGWTASADLPLVNAFDTTFEGTEAAFLAELAE